MIDRVSAGPGVAAAGLVNNELGGGFEYTEPVSDASVTGGQRAGATQTFQ